MDRAGQSVSVLERAALAPDTRGKLLRDTLGTDTAAEAAVLSTCNRIELYADVDRFHEGVSDLTAALSRHSGLPVGELAAHLYTRWEDRAVHHLFSVACGLDSMVVGEGQILGQIKNALALAQEEQSAGRLLNELFQRALRVGKRAHSETAIDRAGQSLVTFGLEQLARADLAAGVGTPAAGPPAPGAEAMPDVPAWIAGKRVLVIGAGSMSSLAATTLARAGATELVIANRTLARAERLADNLNELRGADRVPGGTLSARAVPINAISLAAELRLADLVVSCTGATGLVLTAEQIAAALRDRRHGARRSAGPLLAADGTPAVDTADTTGPDGPAPTRPLALLDLAMPRDVDAAAHGVPGARLVDIESLAVASADAPMAADVDTVRRIVDEEVEEFGAAQRAAAITPTVVALRAMASGVVAGELARLEGRLPGLDDKQRAEVAHAVRRVVDKLLHAPTVRVKELAGEPGGADYAAALRELFDLDARTDAARHPGPGGPTTVAPPRTSPGTRDARNPEPVPAGRPDPVGGHGNGIHRWSNTGNPPDHPTAEQERS
ncbi:glutamyl-tRNA reductase [Streptomyces calidiresistens]|uniref:Glutamyl-tRNA reductase n=1 Tax=Streptomyces calidiresistens TaxID=1485586 RepID=A0A7W3XXD3_9ACTN|nr:glutamyl-tRNA reductase [Streptomyces calidiresistens]MBB0230691.1 glutamyl-tRNA reductase [Streptomyces calidiresistens]